MVSLFACALSAGCAHTGTDVVYQDETPSVEVPQGWISGNSLRRCVLPDKMSSPVKHIRNLLTKDLIADKCGSKMVKGTVGEYMAPVPGTVQGLRVSYKNVGDHYCGTVVASVATVTCHGSGGEPVKRPARTTLRPKSTLTSSVSHEVEVCEKRFGEGDSLQDSMLRLEISAKAVERACGSSVRTGPGHSSGSANGTVMGLMVNYRNKGDQRCAYADLKKVRVKCSDSSMRESPRLKRSKRADIEAECARRKSALLSQYKRKQEGIRAEYQARVSHAHREMAGADLDFELDAAETERDFELDALESEHDFAQNARQNNCSFSLRSGIELPPAQRL